MAKKQKAEDKKNEIVEKKLLSTAPEQHHFFVADGTRIGNLPQLVGALETMHEDTYNFHANSERNDFSLFATTSCASVFVAIVFKLSANSSSWKMSLTQLLKSFLSLFAWKLYVSSCIVSKAPTSCGRLPILVPSATKKRCCSGAVLK